jgi:hypothetical protein
MYLLNTTFAKDGEVAKACYYKILTLRYESKVLERE